MLYTRRGDKGTTKILNCPARFSKNSSVAEALGTMDELNSLLGVVRSRSKPKIAKIIMAVQQNLFIIQAQLAGADKKLAANRIKETEKIIDEIEKKLPPIKSFFVPGATEEGALLDWARAVVRRAERRVVAASENGKIKLEKNTLPYLNRLSSLFYALARLANHQSGIKEEPPTYK